MQVGVIESFFLIFAGATVLATAALYTRQPLLVAYIGIGVVLGPHALGWIPDAAFIQDIGEIGIIFLLFLLGLDLPPSKLKNMAGASIVTALASSAAFFALGFVALKGFGFSTQVALIAGIASMFSSTIVGIKLLPTTVLHHRHTGEVVISLLLIQDLIAIVALILLAGFAPGAGSSLANLGQAAIALPAVGAAAFAGVKFVVIPLLKRFDVFGEFIFLLAVGWCLSVASVAHLAGMSFEVGAIIAGVSLANSPIAQYITEMLRPLRDFFLILFFFSVGAAINPSLLLEVMAPALVLGGLLLAIKPLTFRFLLAWQGETRETAWEVGCRLGQASEFSLLVTAVAMHGGLLDAAAAHVLQGATVITLVASIYLVIFRYPSPIAVAAALRRD